MVSHVAAELRLLHVLRDEGLSRHRHALLQYKMVLEYLSRYGIR